MEENKLYYYPMKMLPIYKDYLWGGKKLKFLNKKTDMPFIAESWEVSCNDAGLTKIENGFYRDYILKDVINLSRKSFLGEKFACDDENIFPLIVKFIDAEKDLSIQVHPSEKTAKPLYGEFAKSELWYIIDCEPNSYIYCGFKKDVNKEEFINSINDKNICDLLNKINVKKGEAYYIPAGTIHALGKGILVTEIQQNSNTTFRIYDYDRMDSNGNLRELHVDRAKDVLNFKKTRLNYSLKNNFSGFECDYFKVEKKYISTEQPFYNSDQTFKIIQFVSGKGEIICKNINYKCEFGDTFFIPAKISNYKVKGNCELLIIKI